MSHSSVRRIYIDNDGGIWLGTFFEGLNIYDPAKREFLIIKTAHGLGSDDVKAISIDETEGDTPTAAFRLPGEQHLSVARQK